MVRQHLECLQLSSLCLLLQALPPVKRRNIYYSTIQKKINSFLCINLVPFPCTFVWDIILATTPIEASRGIWEKKGRIEIDSPSTFNFNFKRKQQELKIFWGGVICTREGGAPFQNIYNPFSGLREAQL